jgi:hypothetical protein
VLVQLVQAGTEDIAVVPVDSLGKKCGFRVDTNPHGPAADSHYCNRSAICAVVNVDALPVYRRPEFRCQDHRYRLDNVRDVDDHNVFDEIPDGDRDEWRRWLATQQEKIVTKEPELVGVPAG